MQPSYDQVKERLKQAGFSDRYRPLWAPVAKSEFLSIAWAWKGEDRRKGLLGKDHLDNGVALLLSTPLIHSWGMKMPFDAIWVSHGKIVSVKENVSPDRPLIFGKSMTCLELAAGETSRLDLAVGSPLEIKPLGSKVPLFLSSRSLGRKRSESQLK